MPWLRLAGSLLAAGLIIYLLAQQGWEQIVTAIQQIAWQRFALAMALMIISRLAVTARWHVLLRSAEIQASFGQSLRITFAGLFASNFLPTTIGGDVIRLGGAIRLGFNRAVSLASLLVDRLVGMAGMALALPLLLPALAQVGISSQGSSSGLLLAGVAPAQAGWPQSLLAKLRQGIAHLMEALSIWLHRPASLMAALACTLVHMLCLFGQIAVLLGGMGEPIPFWMIAGLWSATYFITLLPVSINGMGVQELATTFFYGTLGGISAPASLTLALLLRVLQMLVSLPGALFVPEMLAGAKKSA